MARVVLNKVSKVYPGGIAAVKEASLEIEDKEFVVLVGPSGCGKSTTLRMIAGLEELTDGEISIGGEVVNDVAPKDRDIAMVFQNYALYPHMSVYQNMTFGLKLRKFPKSEIDARVREAAQILGITDLLERRPKALSGGQKQRVALGRAIVRQPKVFLFDEPLSNLDAKLRVQMRAEIARLHSRLQATMVYVTHDQVEAMTMGDRIVVMLDGEIQQVDEPLTLYKHPGNQFIAGFIGNPPMNLISGTIRQEENNLLFEDGSEGLQIAVQPDRFDALRPYIGAHVTLGARPEAFRENQGQDGPECTAIQAALEVVEPQGADIYVYFRLGPSLLTARLPPGHVPSVGETLSLHLDTAQLHYFDAKSQQAIV